MIHQHCQQEVWKKNYKFSVFEITWQTDQTLFLSGRGKNSWTKVITHWAATLFMTVDFSKMCPHDFPLLKIINVGEGRDGG